MNTRKCFALSLVLLAISIPSILTAQTVSGKWYGLGQVEVEQATNSYLCELLITQDGTKVSGEFNYYFRNGYFSNKVKGTFTVDNRYMYIQLLPIMYNRTVNTLIGVDCPMHGEFILKVSRAGTTLDGNFITDDLHKYTCAPLKINFNKLLKDEPTLKQRIEEMAHRDSIEDNDTAITPVAVETPKQIVPNAKVAVSAVAGTANEKITEIAEAAEANMKLRINSLVRVLDVSDDSVKVDLYDNGELDYDTATVFYNNKLVQYRRLLDTRRPIEFYVHVDTADANNELTMYADNLGLIPPNSALMVITDKSHRYEISMITDFDKNATVRLHKVRTGVMQSR